jgi:hypothetical protein
MTSWHSCYASCRAPDAMERLIECLQKLVEDLDAMAIAEALWLSANALPDGSSSPPLPDESEPLQAEQSDWLPTGGPPPGETATVPDADGTDDVSIGLLDAPTSAAATVPGWRVQVPKARSLPRPLDLARSLRPFKRSWPKGRRMELDLEATTREYARTGSLVPAFRPAPERWFDVALLIDESPTMTIWEEVVTEFGDLLQQLGAFRLVRSWQLGFDGVTATLRNARGQLCGPDQIRSSDRRRLILVVSDCCAEGWYHPHVWQLLRSWAMSSPTTLVNPLSVRLWRHTGLDLPAVSVAPTAIGTPNSRLAFRMPLLLQATGDSGGNWLPLPAVTFTPHSLGRWAKTLMRNDPAGCDALLLPPSDRIAEPFEDESNDADEVMSSDALVDIFQRIASPAAARLGVHSRGEGGSA